ncbi:MBL fold metallo-hydrolase [Deinococcus sp. Leaf326]|jgi:glyoxylase-like metal-dependent hydrolase (beta-lactamase superfamily II)|uniref:MBL fold metallo-hydrolase n=1 Tax=Deinococcus sp. Leaf326 TaxID=1736338 RepID=UPI0006FA64DA|nr:MBL fold metallo-hydrolase [Deinococcus sp. Leaf326]KQR27803.1 MBL fold metallo-hydrolase [Deinococcus sp. Leaf326]
MTTAPLLTPVTGTLHALQVPIPYPMKYVTVLIDAPAHGPVTMIDTALDTPEARQAIEDGLAALGLHWESIDRVIITHHHPDHYGLAGVVEERSGARVQMLDVEIGRGERYWHLWEEWLPGHLKFMRDHGLPAESLASMGADNRKGRDRVHPASAVQPLREGQNVELAGGEWEVLWLPGHADGHLGLWNEHESVLIAGDAILPRISPNVGLYAYTRPDPLGDYLQTLGKLELLNPVRAVVGHHGPVMTGVQARARELRAHHHERLDFIRAEVARQPGDAYALSLAMFPRDLNISGRRFALAETLAHAEHLRLLGGVYRTWDEAREVWVYHG